MKVFNFEDETPAQVAVDPEPKVEPKIDSKPTVSGDDFSSFLSDYSDVTPNKAPAFDNEGGAAPQLQGNTLITGDVYKTGKKAGQPRKPRVTANLDHTQTTLGGEILTGALMLTLVDLLFPAIISALNNRFTKDKIKASDLQLTAKQKSEIAPIADKVLKQINFNANPNALLIFSVVAIYGTNFAIAKMMSSKPEPKNEKANEEKQGSFKP